MKISTKGRYALRLMTDIALHGEESNVSIKDVAEREGISEKYLEQIVRELCKVGYLKSTRGSQGGYRLTRKPSEYRVGDILRITEGKLAPISCLADDVNTCPKVSVCAGVEFWSGLYKVINEYVDSYTLEDLAVNKVKKNGGPEYYI